MPFTKRPLTIVIVAALAFPCLTGLAQNRPWENSQFGASVFFDGNFGSRHGIEGNDFSASAFLPWHIVPNRNIVFAVVRGTVANTQPFVANAGLGQRLYVDRIDSIFGANIWFDLDDSHGTTYYRTGGQVEVMTSFVEFRGGADIVLGGTATTLVESQSNSPAFVGNNIAFGFWNAETPYDHGYLEAGGPLPWLGKFGLNFYGGAYFLWADEADSSVGGQARITADVTPEIQLGARYTHDETFGSNVSFNAILAIPSGGWKQMVHSFRSLVAHAPGQLGVASKLNSPVVRDHRTPVQVVSTSQPVLALDATGSRPIFVLHVDPNAASAGDGTFENPFNSLEAARLANDRQTQIIRVVPRNDGTGTNLALNAPFQLLADQRLLSSSVAHQFTALRGTFALPGFTGGATPVLTNSNGSASAVVVMVDGTEVSGFTIDGGARHIGVQGNIDSFDINRNTIENSTHGVQLSNAQGHGVINQNVFRDNLNDAVNVTATNGNHLTLELTGNTATGNGDDAVDITTTGTRLTLTFVDNDFGGNARNGIRVTSRADSIVFLTLRGNRLGQTGPVGGNGNAGFQFDADSGFANLTIGGSNPAAGNVVLGNGGGDLVFELTDDALAIVSSQNNVTPAPQTGSNSFDISFELRGGFTASQKALFDQAATRWESIIIGDLPEIGSLDDVHIVANVEAIDGLGGTLARAVPTGLRAESFLPFLGKIVFDSADLFSLPSDKLRDVVLHETAHVLGFATVWNQLRLVSGEGGADPRFTGSQATAEFNARFGLSDGGVPLENTGGGGTVDAHWRESIFTNELMTGTVSGTSRPISRITIGQFIDLGYDADLSKADAF